MYLLRHPRRALGLSSNAPKDTWLMLRGDSSLPSGKFGLSSLKVMTPRLAFATWRGKQAVPRKVPILNLFNRTPTPIEDGFSVKVTQVEDFRGKRLTYDSHNGTDFVIPPGTEVVPVARGRVVSIRNEYNRGGLKMVVEHGKGLMSTYHHLAEAKLAVGDDVHVGQTIALSGYSGLDAIAGLGQIPPHVHFNAIQNGVLTDPFARENEDSLWMGDTNTPTALDDDGAPFAPTQFDDKAVLDLLDSMTAPHRQEALANLRGDIYRLAFELTIEATTYPTRFQDHKAARVLFDDSARAPRMRLPFKKRDYDHTVFADDENFR